MRTKVIERNILLDGKLPDTVTQTVVQALHQSTLLNVENLVKCAGNMEAKSIHIVVLCTGLHLFPCKPAFVAESKFQLIAVLTCLLRAKNGHNLGQFHLTNALQRVGNLLLLVLQLMFIGQALPFATAAYTVMLAEWHIALLRIFIKLHSLSLGIAMLLALHLQINHIAGHHVGHKNNQVIDTCKGFTLGCNTCNFNPLKQRQLFLFSCHYNRILIFVNNTVAKSSPAPKHMSY